MCFQKLINDIFYFIKTYDFVNNVDVGVLGNVSSTMKTLPEGGTA